MINITIVRVERDNKIPFKSNDNQNKGLKVVNAKYL